MKVPPVHRTLRFLRDVIPSDMAGLALPRHEPPTLGTPDIVPLVPLAQSVNIFQPIAVAHQDDPAQLRNSVYSPVQRCALHLSVR